MQITVTAPYVNKAIGNQVAGMDVFIDGVQTSCIVPHRVGNGYQGFEQIVENTNVCPTALREAIDEALATGGLSVKPVVENGVVARLDVSVGGKFEGHVYPDRDGIRFNGFVAIHESTRLPPHEIYEACVKAVEGAQL